MKISILIAVLILIVSGLIGWRKHETREELREVYREVLAEAKALGVSMPTGTDGGTPEAKISRREREAREAEVRAFAAELIAFSKEMEEMSRSGDPAGEEAQERVFAMIERLLELDVSEMKLLVEEMRASDLDDRARQQILSFVVMMMAQDHPEAALTLFTESSDLMEMDMLNEHMMAAALGRLASEDPMVALDWIRENEEKHPDLVSDQAKRAVLVGAARQDPALALSLIEELGLEDDAGGALGQAAVTDEQRDALLAALRGQDDEGLKVSALSTMLGQLAGSGFEKSRAWLSGADLSDEEKSAAVMSLSQHQTNEDTGRWIEWIGENAGEERASKTEELMRDWTRRDYRAAGEWLAEASVDRATNQAAVSGYVDAVAPHDPQAAAQWVETMPEGEARRKAAEKVFHTWRGEDEAAAKRFAEAEGLE